MRYRSGLAALTTTLALAAVAACGSSPDPVAWTDKVCTSVLAFTDKVSTHPDIDPRNPAGAVRGLSDYLGTAVTALDDSLAGLNAAGPSPIAGGDEIVNQMKTAFTSVRSAFQTARTKIDALDTSNPSALASGLGDAVTPLSDLSTALAPIENLRSNPDLEAAAKKAPSCQKLPS